MKRIKYYSSNRNEVLEISDIHGNIIKSTTYTQGNCLVDLLFDDKCIKINPHLKAKITCLLNVCNDYLKNNIQVMIEEEFAFAFEQSFTCRYEFIENKLCRVLYTENIETLLWYLIISIYETKTMYKKCSNCNKYFATKYQRAKYCNRIACINGRTCREVGVTKTK
ncbi:MAG: hypothetical protein KAQ68_04415 [Clostridiales bacterium]|nr:hypothetical protein [Clostridiales bacterium]